MRALADAIVLTVGYHHYNRMNAERLGWGAIPVEKFLDDMRWRLRSEGGALIVDYLRNQLTQRRLALPTGYVVGSWRKKETA